MVRSQFVNTDALSVRRYSALPEARKLPPHGQWKLRYRIILQRDPWTPQTLSAAALEWNRAAIMHSAVIDWNEVPAKQADVRVLRQFCQGPTATLDELKCTHYPCPRRASHAPHTHPNEEIVIIKEGTVEAFSNGEWKRVGPGSVIFNASNEAHAIRNVGSGRRHITSSTGARRRDFLRLQFGAITAQPARDDR